MNRPVHTTENENKNDNDFKLRHLYKCIHPKAKQTNSKQTRKGTSAEPHRCPNTSIPTHKTFVCFQTYCALKIFKETFIAVKRFYSPTFGSRFCRNRCTNSGSVSKLNGFGVWPCQAGFGFRVAESVFAVLGGHQHFQGFARLRGPLLALSRALSRSASLAPSPSFSPSVIRSPQMCTLLYLGLSKPTLCQFVCPSRLQMPRFWSPIFGSKFARIRAPIQKTF